ncbi:Protein terminal ear1 [Apostasia shenzhenica]|uniref:Protein terminal ear1 n=1 Tax=Apostasia shenzhenica TaxID=1088818 RepID=A0A2I0AGL6_9ASPA|nr:Protein terminal ear1 [Apostasia shenzhenica]
MEGGFGIGTNSLDPGAVEFYPATQFAPVPPQICYHYPPPPPPPAAVYPPPQLHLQYGTMGDDCEPTRAVVLGLVPPHVDEATITSSMAAFGAVRAVEMAALASEGAATVHFYDLRSAVAAVFEIREQHVRQQSRLGQQFGVVPANWGMLDFPAVANASALGGRGLIAGHAVWAQFSARGVDGPNQGSLFVYNCDPTVPSAFLAELFGSFGDVKEVRETPWKPNQRFVEFYDIRDAARALADLNGKEINGRRLAVEFTRSAVHGKRSGVGQQRGFAHPPRLLRSGPPERPGGRWVEVSLPSSSSGGRAGQREGSVALINKSSSAADGSGRKFANNSNPSRMAKGTQQEAAPSSTAALSSSSSSSFGGSGSAKQHHMSRRGWKNHSRNNGGETRFQFKEVETEEGSSSTSCRDARTTVMIKNIPNKYSQKLLLGMLDNHCIRCNEEIGEDDDEPMSAYDFVYLPIDFKGSGRAFQVKIITALRQSAKGKGRRCRAGKRKEKGEGVWKRKRWRVSGRPVRCAARLHHLNGNEGAGVRQQVQCGIWIRKPNVAGGRRTALQSFPHAAMGGLQLPENLSSDIRSLADALKEHFKNSKFACDTDEYMPVIFCPPRDGKQLTEPETLGGRGMTSRRGLHLDLAPTAGVPDPGPGDPGGASLTCARMV